VTCVHVDMCPNVHVRQLTRVSIVSISQGFKPHVEGKDGSIMEVGYSLVVWLPPSTWQYNDCIMVVAGVGERMPLDNLKAGILGYMAPEVAVLHMAKPDREASYRFPSNFEVGQVQRWGGEVGLAADMWSVGVLIYEIYTGLKWMPPDDTIDVPPEQQLPHQLRYQIKELEKLVSQAILLGQGS
jgi:hypothetical protein